VPFGHFEAIPESICRALSLLESPEERADVAAQLYAGGQQPTGQQARAAVDRRRLEDFTPEQQLALVQAASARSHAASARVDRSANDNHGRKGGDGQAKIYRAFASILREMIRSDRHFAKWTSADRRTVLKIMNRCAKNWRDTQRLLGQEVAADAEPQRMQPRRRAA
jgi:hypothetical protein